MPRACCSALTDQHLWMEFHSRRVLQAHLYVCYLGGSFEVRCSRICVWRLLYACVKPKACGLWPYQHKALLDMTSVMQLK